MKSKKAPKCILRDRKTKAVEIFRTTPPKTVCPNFYVLSHANGCMFDPQCEYCYLKSSFWYLGGQQAFTNVEGIIEEARKWIGLDNLESYVLNTGNLSDSLSFEPARPLIGDLVELFRDEAEARGRPHSLLIVTKGGVAECAPFFGVSPCRNVIVSFSINSPEAAAMYEKGAAEVADRFEALRRLKSLGWRLRIRIDPMIKGFDYSAVIEETRRVAPERVTLGTLRAEAGLLKSVNHATFSDLEKPTDPRALARYPRDIRVALYRQAAEALKGVCEVGLCEEEREVWELSGLEETMKRCNCGL